MRSMATHLMVLPYWACPFNWGHSSWQISPGSGFWASRPSAPFWLQIVQNDGGRGPHRICSKDAPTRGGRRALRNFHTKLCKQGGGGGLYAISTQNCSTLLVTSPQQKIFSKLSFKRRAPLLCPGFSLFQPNLAWVLCAIFSHGVPQALEVNDFFQMGTILGV